MKIAMIGHKRIPTRSGGVEVVVQELSVRMAKKGHDVTVYNRYCRGDKKLAKNEYDGVKVIEIPTFKRNSLNALVYSVIASFRVLFGGYDVIHYHAEGPCAMIWLPKLFRIPVVATIHGLDWQRAKWGGFATHYLKFGEKMAAKYADEVIVLSDNMQKYFFDRYGRKTLLIQNGVIPIERKKPNIILKKYGLKKNDYFLFLARIVPEKGLEYLLEAYSRLDTVKKLVIAGALEPETDYIKNIKKAAALDPRIILTDFVAGNIMAELFSNCLAYVMPSDLEGMPISLLEALSCHARCIVSDIPEITEVVGDYAHIFHAGNVKKLRELMQMAINNEGLYDSNFREGFTPEQVDAKIETILKRHDWGLVANETLKVYGGVTGR
ncbi:MAG: glycosyltransferase family 4 protein [Bacillota bacterium]|nr:glycosyltransferase family 4 protein [Bacillota bacterium]